MTDKECNRILREYLQIAMTGNDVVINLGDQLTMNQFVDDKQFKIVSFHKEEPHYQYNRLHIKLSMSNMAIKNDDFDIRLFSSYKLNAALRKYKKIKEADCLQITSNGNLTMSSHKKGDITFMEFFLDVKCLYKEDYEILN